MVAQKSIMSALIVKEVCAQKWNSSAKEYHDFMVAQKFIMSAALIVKEVCAFKNSSALAPYFLYTS